MVTGRLRWVRSRIGPKPGKGAVQALLIDPSDLPGTDWRQIDARTWRTGSNS